MIHVDFVAWEPIYEKILEDFGFDRIDDEEAARFLFSMLIKNNTLNLSELEAAIPENPSWYAGTPKN